MTFKKVIENNFCVGCGACAAVPDVPVNIDVRENGFYQAKVANDLSEDQINSVNKLCPFSSAAKNEDELGSHLFKDKKHDDKIGFYDNLYAGYRNLKEDRLNSSSGGLTTWFAEKLLENDEIDSIIHVGQTDNIFEYKVSKAITELKDKANKKSRYYPVTYSHLTEYIVTTKDRLLFIGIPCIVKSIRLLQKEYDLTNIKYVVALLCGHMKSKYFAESLAWQLGISPKNLQAIDFRVKKPNYKASDYFISVQSKITQKNIVKKNQSLLGANWGHGFFKHKSCDFCDDLAGELADVTFGDAWLSQYTSDYLGTNIVISRSKVFDQYIKDFSEEVTLDKVTIDDFYNTQAGNYRHRRDGLPVRVKNSRTWTPTKRLNLSAQEVNKERENLYLYRSYLSEKSTHNFIIAKKYNSIIIFRILMLPILLKYDLINLGLLKAIKFNIKKCIANILNLFRKKY
ncbi:MAG: coenzyme F420 hydrogenase subunit beta [Psychromonas sp.]|jgi:coenzyme F420 hydrogenase subunit beta|uniref:Coenzyme F420 hydrogenase/dehydrogenase, beta subunit C-terminal domain n=1 Tax=Psychromonas sp. TaxID=1884585 RepID=UPI0039E728CD